MIITATTTTESLLEADGLLNVDNPPDGSLSYQADHYARLHPTAIDDVRDFHALTDRYDDKLRRVQEFPPRRERR
jgi:hypothetical protein